MDQSSATEMSLVLWSGLTIGTYLGFRWLFRKTGIALLHPVLWATLSVFAAIEITGHSYAAYQSETHWMVWLLGPAVVALALPVYNRRSLILGNLVPLSIIIVASVLFSVFSIKIMLATFHLDPSIVRSLSLKSVTAPVALELSAENGGVNALTAIGAMFAGIMGAVLGPWVLKISRVADPKALGLALGCGSHGIGTARAIELGETQGAFASIGMSCSAIASSIICPLILRYLI
jgi:putative effector of murein hydrolase